MVLAVRFFVPVPVPVPEIGHGHGHAHGHELSRGSLRVVEIMINAAMRDVGCEMLGTKIRCA